MAETVTDDARGDVVAPQTAADLAVVKELFREYAESLDFNLCFQDFDQEMADFPGKYAGTAGGALLLARLGDDVVGAVGLRDLGDGICEMKRLYLRPAARGTGLGARLVHDLVAQARTLGYRAMRLDTVPGHHDRAIALYRQLGFRDIEAYCHNPVPGAIFMELDL